jgi:hypothetical protein
MKSSRQVWHVKTDSKHSTLFVSKRKGGGGGSGSLVLGVRHAACTGSSRTQEWSHSIVGSSRCRGCFTGYWRYETVLLNRAELPLLLTLGTLNSSRSVGVGASTILVADEAVLWLSVPIRARKKLKVLTTQG